VPRSVFLGWSDDDRDWALALLAYEADLCACGQPRSESMSPDNEGGYTTEPLRCHACAAVARGGEPFSEPGNDPRGLFISVTKARRDHG
jgi:hypothetical protein